MDLKIFDCLNSSFVFFLSIFLYVLRSEHFEVCFVHQHFGTKTIEIIWLSSYRYKVYNKIFIFSVPWNHIKWKHKIYDLRNLWFHFLKNYFFYSWTCLFIDWKDYSMFFVTIMEAKYILLIYISTSLIHSETENVSEIKIVACGNNKTFESRTLINIPWTCLSLRNRSVYTIIEPQ